MTRPERTAASSATITPATVTPTTVTPTGRVATLRSRYFSGKFMNACDFATDPEYLLNRHRLHQRRRRGLLP